MTTDKPKSQAGLGKIFGLVAVLTVLSKVAGLARDIIVLKYFGTSYLNDAYNYAGQFSTLILVLFGGLGGPFHQATVAILTPRKNEESTGRLVTQITILTVLVLSAVAAIIWFAAPYLIPLIASAQGHPLDYKQKLWAETLAQLHIMIPIVVITGVVGISYGVLNVYGRFFWPSLSPSIASLAIIVSVVGWSGTVGAACLAVGSLVGAIGQMLAQVPGVVKSHLKWGISLKPQPGLSEYFRMLGPAVISTSVGTLTTYIDMNFASQLPEGAWTAVSNANRLIQLPLGVLLTAMLVPILPRFTEQVMDGKIDDLKAELRRALNFLWFLSLPITALLMACPREVITVLFQRGHFNQQSTALVTEALVFMVPMIFFYVGRDLITRVFYAHHDAKTPYYVAMIAIGVKWLLNCVLVGPFGIGGISLATTLITVLNLSLLTFFLKRKIGYLGFSRLLKPLAIMLIASAACGSTAFALQQWSASHLPQTSFLVLFGSLAASCTTGLVVYGAICFVFKLEEPIMLLKRLRRQKAANIESQ